MRTALIAALLALACLVSAFDPANYPNKVVFREDYTLYWKLNGDKLQFGLSVNTQGWFAIGISEPTAGSMPGSDMAVISYEGNKPVVNDHYATEFAYPPLDDCQDWVLLSFDIENGVSMAELERKIDTGDSQDRPLEAGMMMMVFAYGTDSQTTMQYHDSRRGTYAVEFWRSDISQPFPPETDLEEDTYLIGNFEIPTRATTYACIAHKIPVERADGDRHIVRVEPVMDPRTHGITHHMLVHMCVDNNPLSWASLFNGKAGQCLSPIGMPFSGCNSLLYGWAMGMDALNSPLEAGARMGYGTGTFQYIVAEMHYDNPDAIRGLVDNSGYKMYWTKQMRKYDAATLTTGDPYISFPSIPPFTKSFGLESTCPGQCTSQFKDDLHIYTSGLHMHATGSQMWTSVYRDDKYIGTVARSDFFVFDMQRTNYVNITVKPGDRLNTHCVFNTQDRALPTRFGYASLSEMCMDFLGYYPRQEFGLGGFDFAYCGYFGYTGVPITLCGSNQAFLTGQSLLFVGNPIASDLEETREISFGKQPASCAAKE